MTIDGRAVASAPPGSTGSRRAAGGMTDDVGPLADGQAAAVALARGDRRIEARAADRALERQRLVRPERRRAGRPARILATDGQRDARPRVERLDRRVGPEREDGAGRRDRCPRVAVRLGAVAPQPPCLGGVAPEVDGLDAGRDPAGGEPAAIGRVEQLDVLDPGHERDAPAVGSRTSSAARTAASPIAWICVAMPPAAARVDELAQLLGLGVPDAAPQLGRERPVGLGLDVGEQRGRPRPERAVGEALLPADACTTGRVPAEDRRRWQAAARARSRATPARSDARTRIGRRPVSARWA